MKEALAGKRTITVDLEPDRTCNQWAEDWERLRFSKGMWCTKKPSLETFRIAKCAVKYFVLPVVGDKLLSTVTASDVEKILAPSRQSGQARIYQAAFWTRAFFKDAVSYGILIRSPAAAFLAATPARRIRTTVPPSRFLEFAELAGDSDAGRALTFALFTGVRRQIILRMRWSWVLEIDPGGDVPGCLLIDRAQTKNNKDQKVPVHRIAWNAMGAKNPDALARVFPGVYANLLLSELRRIGAAMGIQNLVPHGLRWSYAQALEDSGAPLMTIRDALGHSNVDTTTTYLERSNRDISKYIKDFAAYNEAVKKQESRQR